MLIVIGWVLGVASTIGTSWLLSGKYYHRTAAVFGLLVWPFVSLFLWVAYVTKMLKSPYTSAFVTFGNIIFQIRTNTSYKMKAMYNAAKKNK